jgi:hypothetical protein
MEHLKVPAGTMQDVSGMRSMSSGEHAIVSSIRFQINSSHTVLLPLQIRKPLLLGKAGILYIPQPRLSFVSCHLPKECLPSIDGNSPKQSAFTMTLMQL